MDRGDVIIAGQRGAYTSKPRPWLVVQNPLFLEEPSSITVCPISATARAASFRVAVRPDDQNGLREASVIVIDKLMTLNAENVQEIAGAISASLMSQVDAALRYWLSL